MTHNITAEASARYDAISKRAGADWAEASRAASHAYHRELEPHSALFHARVAKIPLGTNTPETTQEIYEASEAYSNAMTKANGRHDKRMEKANSRMAATMKAAYEELLQGKPSQLAQMELFES